MSVITATFVAGAISAVALGFRLNRAGGFEVLAPEALPLWFVAGFLCLAVVARRRFPPGAWLAAVAAGGLAAIEVVGSVRALEAGVPAGTWPWLVGTAELALLGAVVIAAAYAVRGSEVAGSVGTRTLRRLVLAAVTIVAGVGAWALAVSFGGDVPSGAVAQADGAGISALRISGRVSSGFVAAAVLVGMWRDLSGPLRRARSKAQGLADLPRALGEELLPRASAMRDRGRQEERARLAADLHALVLPDLRRAARTAEAAGDVGQPLASELRQAVEGIERLMHERQSIVFEEFGLVAALEWLAERTQEQAPIEVSLELGGATEDPEALPKAVTRAAFRVAILAVDNVVRHAGASHLALALETGDRRLILSTVDDGRGQVAEPELPRSPRPSEVGRGLTDMRSAATEVGATVEIQAAADGTRVAFRWADPDLIAGKHAAAPGHAPAGPRALDR